MLTSPVKLYRSIYNVYYSADNNSYYQNLDELPAINYLKLRIEGDIRQLIKGRISKVNFLTVKNLNTVYLNILDQVRVLKKDDREERILIKLKIQAMNHMQNAILTGNANDKIFAKLAIEKINDKIQSNNDTKVSVYDSIFAHKKAMGHSSDYKSMSAREFLADLDNLSAIYGKPN